MTLSRPSRFTPTGVSQPDEESAAVKTAATKDIEGKSQAMRRGEINSGVSSTRRTLPDAAAHDKETGSGRPPGQRTPFKMNPRTASFQPERRPSCVESRR